MKLSRTTKQENVCFCSSKEHWADSYNVGIFTSRAQTFLILIVSQSDSNALRKILPFWLAAAIRLSPKRTGQHAGRQQTGMLTIGSGLLCETTIITWQLLKNVKQTINLQLLSHEKPQKRWHLFSCSLSPLSSFEHETLKTGCHPRLK